MLAEQLSPAIDPHEPSLGDLLGDGFAGRIQFDKRKAKVAGTDLDKKGRAEKRDIDGGFGTSECLDIRSILCIVPTLTRRISA
jgi:hypothetical protein